MLPRWNVIGTTRERAATRAILDTLSYRHAASASRGMAGGTPSTKAIEQAADAMMAELQQDHLYVRMSAACAHRAEVRQQARDAIEALCEETQAIRIAA